ncbi:mucoidy inhibitor MuiA family protein [Flectobacillus major]|uniref:mucoidy inhibitor MuiA family protein n=1 Tax=Flectobacillus major TaxID=103 RepID=UPI00041C8640|nr:mucoidy inhibitor MuiA family protein [Flectobacillus major]
MKLIINILVWIGFFPNLFYPKTQIVSSKIDYVTVFPQGAQVIRQAKTDIQVGKTDLVFAGLAPQLDVQSIQVNTDAKINVVFVSHRLNDTEKQKQETIRKYEEQKLTIDDKIKGIKSLLVVYKREEELLVKNQTLSGPSKIEDLKQLVDYQRIRMTEVLTKQLELERSIRGLEQEQKKINQALTDLTLNTENLTSEIVVTIEAKEPVVGAKFSISYFVNQAGWTPFYDVRANDITKPLRLAFKGNVYQYSGEDWKDITLGFSTANPRKKSTPPSLKNWYWGEPNDYSSYFAESYIAPIITEINGKVRDRKSLESLAGVSVSLKGTSIGAMTDANGNYRINVPPNLQKSTLYLVFSSIGFQNKELRVSQNTLNVDLEEDSKALEEVVVAGYGRNNNLQTDDVLQGRVNGLNVKSAAKRVIEVNEKEAPTSLLFEVMATTTILSDAKTYMIDIKEEDIPVLYEYSVVPKIDTDVFLRAKLFNWDKYNLMEGEMNLFLEGTYLGKTSLQLTKNDTLDISLGRDKSIIVVRKKLKEMQKKQFLGSNKTDNFEYEINIRNTKNIPIQLIVEDQFPISKSKEIEVFDKSAPDATIEESSGKISWNIKIEPFNQKKLSLKYSVKYPKNGITSTE